MYAHRHVYTEYLYTTHPHIYIYIYTYIHIYTYVCIHIRTYIIPVHHTPPAPASMNKQEQSDKIHEHRHAIVEHPQYIYRMHAFRHDLGQREKKSRKKKKVTFKRDFKRYLLDEIGVCLGKVSFRRCL